MAQKMQMQARRKGHEDVRGRKKSIATSIASTVALTQTYGEFSTAGEATWSHY